MNIDQIPDLNAEFKFEDIFIIMKLLHQKSHEYTIEADALEYTASLHFSNEKNIDMTNLSDSYLHSVFSKAKTQHLRISSIIGIILVCFKMRKQYLRVATPHEDTGIDHQAVIERFTKLNDEMDNFRIVELNDCKVSQKIMEYYINQKLTMSGYVFENDRWCEYQKIKIINIDNEDFTIHYNILTYNGIHTFFADIQKKIRKCDRNLFESICDQLAKDNLGRITKKKRDPASQRGCMCFQKFEIPKNDKEKIEFIDNLGKYGVGVSDYMLIFEHIHLQPNDYFQNDSDDVSDDEDREATASIGKSLMKNSASIYLDVKRNQKKRKD